MKKLIFTILCVLLANSMLFAQEYTIKKHVFGASAQTAESNDFKFLNTVGQPGIGTAQNNEVMFHSGFWYPDKAEIVLVAPANNAINIAVLPTFEWQALAGEIEYNIQVAEDEDFLLLVIDELTEDDSYTATQALDNSSLYYWRVIAYVGQTEVSRSRTWSFTTGLPAGNVLVNATVLLHGNWNGTTHTAPLPITIELRTGTTLFASTLYARKAALLNAQGQASATFTSFVDGDYWIVIRATGYITIGSAQRVEINGGDVINYNFSNNLDDINNSQSVFFANGRYQMRGGDLNTDRRINNTDVNSFLMPTNGVDVRFTAPVYEDSGILASEDGETTIQTTVLVNGNWNGVAHNPVAVAFELRTGALPYGSNLVAMGTAILNTNGVGTVRFDNLETGNYWLVVRCPGYLPIASAQAIQITQGESHTYDFSNSSDAVIVPAMTFLSNGRYLMRSGDLNSDRRVNTVDLNSFLMPHIGADFRFSMPPF